MYKRQGENVATGGQTLKISMPGTETVTTEQVAKLLDSLNESCPDNTFEQLSLSNVSAAMEMCIRDRRRRAPTWQCTLCAATLMMHRPA